MRGYTETLNCVSGCTVCLCPEEVAIGNGVEMKDPDPDEPPYRDAQGNLMNIVPQAEL